MTDLDRSKLDAMRKQARTLYNRTDAEEDRLRKAVNDKSKPLVFEREFSWLKIRTLWSSTRPGADPLRYTGDGAYGLKSALSAAAHDLAWPRQDPHSKALKVEIYFDPTGKGNLWKDDDRAAMQLIATIEPPNG